MFPNDDICNVEAARLAAKRLFSRYKTRQDKEHPSMGKQEVNRLMKAAYDAINMPYDPNEEDVFSFMSVFDSNNDGKIQLQDIEQMAVKYLCGTQALTGLGGSIEEKTQKSTTMKSQLSSPYVEKQKQQDLSKNSQSFVKSQTPANKRFSSNTLQNETPFKKVYSPRANNQVSHELFRSHKTKESQSSYSYMSNRIKTESNQPTHDISFEEILKMGEAVFKRNKNRPQGITQSSAARTMTQTYELFGKKKFAPNVEDVRVWMKLCDRNQDGIVEWQDYKMFLQRNYERRQEK